MRITPIKLHYGESLPAQVGEVPDFFDVEQEAEPGPEAPLSGYYFVARFECSRAAHQYLIFLGGGAAPGTISPSQAAEALDSLDDYARMDLGVDAQGPRAVLERFIAQNI